MRLAEEIASWSKDTSTKVGAVIVNSDRHILATGYNDFPKNVVDDVPERRERPTKYLFTEHAERNAIYQATKKGTSLEGSTLFCTMFPCADCARAIISTGIRTIVSPKPSAEHWSESHEAAMAMLKEAEINIIELDSLDVLQATHR